MWRSVPGLLVLAAGLFTDAAAEPAFARAYRSRYGYEPSCKACHSEGGGSELNSYGRAFEKGGAAIKTFAALETLDSDGDGASNLDEIRAKSNPGSNDSTPAATGNWLDPAELIPEDVRRHFPGITTWKPLDAVFTAAETERAKALGVSLTKSDETTIYVPFESGKAAGAAVIVPASAGEETFFLVVATDRALVIRAVSPIGTAKAARVADPKASERFLGKNVKDVEGPTNPQSSEGAVAAAVKKAATILHVRLTSATK